MAKANEDLTYYASMEAPGLSRLNAMLEETAFWSKFLLQKSAQQYLVILALTLLLLGAFVLGLIALAPRDNIEIFTKVVLAISTSLVSVDVLGAALAYSAAAREVASVLTKVQATSAEGPETTQTLMILFSDYNSAVESAPLFGPGLYKKYRAKLNALWAVR